MSQAPSPKASLLQTLLIATTIFLGIQFICPKPPDDPRSSAEIFTSLQSQNGKVDDVAALTDFQRLQGKLNAEVDVKKLTKEQADKTRFEASVLLADTQFRAATRKNDFQKMTMAQQALSNLRGEFEKKPYYNEPVKVTPDKEYPRETVTISSLKAEVMSKAQLLGENTAVWGFFPGYQMIDWLVNLTGALPAFSYAFACFLLAVVVRAIIWPLAQKQYMWGRQMAQLAPLVTEIREQYKDKPHLAQEMNMKMMELYKEYGMNPLSGCGPALLQMPLFLLVYSSMLHYRYEFEKGTFLWITDGVAKGTGGFTAANLGERDVPLIVLYGISMIATTLLQPVRAPANAKQQRLMGVSISVIFTILMFTGAFPVPAAFVLYWIFTNILATFQSLRAYRLPLKPLVKVNAPNGGVYPSNGISTNGATPKKTGVPQRHKPKKKK